MTKKTGLGRGLAALLPTDADPSDATRSKADASSTTMVLRELPLDVIVANPRQPRTVFDPDELSSLADSLQTVGFLQPIIVRPHANDRYEIVAGERRFRAAQLAGLQFVPAIVRLTEDAQLLTEALVENLQRVQLNPLEEAAAYQQLLAEFGLTHDDLASRLGRSRAVISNTIRLLKLPDSVQRRLAAGVLSAGHARALLALADQVVQQSLAERIISEELSVRETEAEVRRLMSDPTTSPPAPRGKREIPGLKDLEEDLTIALETRVKVRIGAKSGQLTLMFGSVNELERLVGIIAAGLGQSGAASEELRGYQVGD
ncbi:MAG: ParB/RepB/Spo0J family partition protein [Nitriliruptoraceae bacterium]